MDIQYKSVLCCFHVTYNIRFSLFHFAAPCGPIVRVRVEIFPHIYFRFCFLYICILFVCSDRTSGATRKNATGARSFLWLWKLLDILYFCCCSCDAPLICLISLAFLFFFVHLCYYGADNYESAWADDCEILFYEGKTPKDISRNMYLYTYILYAEEIYTPAFA